MLRWNKVGDTISIDLNNGYTVVATIRYEKESDSYRVTLYLQDNQINMLDLLQDYENVQFKVDKNKNYAEVTKYITTLLSDGKLDYYIERYQYMMKCFDLGNDIMETENLKEEI